MISLGVPVPTDWAYVVEPRNTLVLDGSNLAGPGLFVLLLLVDIFDLRDASSFSMASMRFWGLVSVSRDSIRSSSFKMCKCRALFSFLDSLKDSVRRVAKD